MIKIGNTEIKPNGIDKVYVGSTLVYQATHDTTLVGGANNALNTYIKNNTITNVNIIDRANLPSGTTDITSSITNLTNGYAGVLNGALYITGLAADKKVCSGSTLDHLFNSCTTLTSIDCSNLDTTACTNMQSMFTSCSALTTADVSNFDTSNVTNMTNMFKGCSGLISLDVSNFDTSNVTNIYYMFYNCPALTALDLSGWDTSNVTNMRYMFASCSALTTIYASRSWYPTYTTAVTSGASMFYNCTNLPNYSSSTVDYTKARLSTEGGYMTLKTEE